MVTARDRGCPLPFAHLWPRCGPSSLLVPGMSGPVRARTPPGAPVLRDQGPDRPAGYGKADASLGQATPCLQSQIGRGRHLARLRTAQVMAAVGLSVGVRLQPLASVVNGTVVARPVRTTVAGPRGVGIRSTAGSGPSRRRLTCWQGPPARGSRRVGFEPAVGLPSGAGRRCEGASTCRRARQQLVSSLRRRAALSRHWVEAASASTDRATASLLAHRSGIVLQ